MFKRRKHKNVKPQHLDEIKTAVMEGQQAMNNLQPNMLSQDDQSRTYTDPSYNSDVGVLVKVLGEDVIMIVPEVLNDKADAHHLLQHQGNPNTPDPSVVP